MPELSLRVIRRVMNSAGTNRIPNMAVERTRKLAEKIHRGDKLDVP